MENIFMENPALEKLEDVAKKNGYVLKKELRNRCGYCFEYTLNKNDHSIFVGSNDGNGNKFFRPAEEVIGEMLNGDDHAEEL